MTDWADEKARELMEIYDRHFFEEETAKVLRDAVAAETERCASLDFTSIIERGRRHGYHIETVAKDIANAIRNQKP